MGEFPDLPPVLIEFLHRQTEQRMLDQWSSELDFLVKGTGSDAVS